MGSSRFLLWFLLLPLLLVPGGCDSDTTGVNSYLRVENEIVLLRSDKTVVSIGDDLAVCCGNWEPGAEVFAFKVLFYDSELLQENGSFKMFLVPSEISVGEAVSLPTPEGMSSKIFVVDAGSPINEAGSNILGSSGSFTVTELECGPPMLLGVRFDDVFLGSEFGGIDPVELTGSLTIRAEVNPSEIGCEFGM